MSLSRPALRRTLLAAGAAVAALTLAACSGDGGTQGGSGNSNFVSGKDSIETVAKADRKEAPTLDGEMLDGKRLDTSSSAYKGKVVVVNVWGSWCPPCRAEAKYYVKLSKEMKDQGVEFVGINTRDPNKGPAIEFEKEFGVEYPSFYDPAGKLILRFKGNLSLQGIPAVLVIDRDGKIAARALGGVNDKHLHKMIDPLIAEK
ncbi:TlpA family protein disulfide reductase [Streptomyces sp. NBC_01304]|uniref:TlpA family protein disulfide reductase n=1 Tax=Streptomyces sp. NBC_01304 TaxID=2903818 RepID=UPI002E10D0B0|nr:TlpA family protein disulfide reductase [Streptomyces sp. NBC_01304]